jgi:hypothetical protein
VPSADRAGGAIASEAAPARPRAGVASLPDPFAASTFGIEVVSTEAPFAMRPNQAQLADSVLVPLVNQFSLMQQQMFDQFQQAMGMLVQMFGTMHREQMDVIREELDQLHQLTEELRGLKVELANRSGGSSEPSQEPAGAVAGADRPAAKVSKIAGAAPVTVREPSKDASPIPREPSAAMAPSPVPAPDATRPRSPLAVGPPPPLSSLLTRPRLDPSPAGIGSRSGPDGVDATNSDRDAVAWIHQRIMTLQHERESRWQKILKLLPGVS